VTGQGCRIKEHNRSNFSAMSGAAVRNNSTLAVLLTSKGRHNITRLVDLPDLPQWVTCLVCGPTTVQCTQAGGVGLLGYLAACSAEHAVQASSKPPGVPLTGLRTVLN
jgi:hypothetical protein